MSSRLLRVAMSAVVAGALVAGCGDDGDADVDADVDADAGAETTAATDAVGTSSPTSSDSEEDAPVPPNGEVVDVLALDNTFRPETIEIVAGTEVRWENGGRNDHNVIPVDEDAEWGVDVADFVPGDEYRYVFATPGDYPYYCSLHGTADFGMIGTIRVTG